MVKTNKFKKAITIAMAGMMAVTGAAGVASIKNDYNAVEFNCAGGDFYNGLCTAGVLHSCSDSIAYIDKMYMSGIMQREYALNGITFTIDKATAEYALNLTYKDYPAVKDVYNQYFIPELKKRDIVNSDYTLGSTKNIPSNYASIYSEFVERTKYENYTAFKLAKAKTGEGIYYETVTSKGLNPELQNISTTANTNVNITKDNFNYKAYADTYADLKAAFGYDKDKLWDHYQNHGKAEGRVATAVQTSSANITKDNFNYKAYADTYADLKAAFGYDKDKLWDHYQNHGKAEGRVATTL